MTIHSTATATTVHSPSATDSRKLTFITDQGSALATRSRAFRVRGTVRAPFPAPVRGRRAAPEPSSPPSGGAGYACGGRCGWGSGCGCACDFGCDFR
ncbi:hypothetical protein GCM10009801_47500 [Streptomyces albiaxialis]|uniref:Uncharacterized protein n=1 Tax=Streptomyces albiaxialis TaxID=329523 RepID=A0ABN2W7E6_9ACTN